MHDFVAKGLIPQTLALDEGAAAHYVGRKLVRIVSSRPNAGAYMVRLNRRQVVETPVPVTYLKK